MVYFACQFGSCVSPLYVFVFLDYGGQCLYFLGRFTFLVTHHWACYRTYSPVVTVVLDDRVLLYFFAYFLGEGLCTSSSFPVIALCFHWLFTSF
jgi:hypothetical protein